MTVAAEIAELEERKALYLAQEQKILETFQSGSQRGRNLQRAELETVRAAIREINDDLRRLGSSSAGSVQFLRSNRT